MDELLLLVFFAVAIGAIFYLYVVAPVQLAKDRCRSRGFWLLVSLFANPFQAIFLLLLLGHSRTCAHAGQR